MASCVPTSRPSARRLVVSAVALACFLAGAPAVAASAIYKWVDSEGITHLSSDRPPPGVKFERMSIGGSGGSKSSSSPRTSTASSAKGNVRLASASAEQVARRNAVISELQNRECVVALEAIDRMARGGRPVDPTDFRRRQQTADLNCSKDPVTRRQQEEQAARLRVSKGDACVDARNELAEMLAPGRRPSREQLKTQQEFIESHCRVPVR